MRTVRMPGSDLPVSAVGIGGHYKVMEEGMYEARYARISAEETEDRIRIISRAFEAGVNYFDTTWRNEVVMLEKVISALGIRDKVFINGMVLGAFTGSAHHGMTPEAYFSQWMTERLRIVPGARFDAMMVNAIEEGFDEEACAGLVRLLEKHRQAGDIGTFGFSCHQPAMARRVADLFPEMKIVMIPYNFHNRAFEQAFSDYRGDAAFVAMKPLVWKEYGIPFCALKQLPDVQDALGTAPAAASAFRFILSHPGISTLVSAINSQDELTELLAAGNSAYTPEDEALLLQYQAYQEADGGIALYVSALMKENLRMNFFGISHLLRALGSSLPEVPLNEDRSPALLEAHVRSGIRLLEEKGYHRYSSVLKQRYSDE